MQGLNACIAYGSAPGNICTAADAIKAYAQAFLKSKYKTWIELSPELRPEWWRTKFVRPVVLLIRALYGHPDAGGLWEAHLKEVLKGLGGVEVQEYPGNFWFHEEWLLLSTYVDDLTLAGPRAAHAPFWDKLCALVNVEPPEPIYRILGRNHVYVKHTLEDKTKIEALAFDMCDYAQQTVDLYKAITKSKKIKNASTPFLPEGSLLPQDEEVTGELAGNAAKILMKALWLARLARPDILRPINDLERGCSGGRAPTIKEFYAWCNTYKRRSTIVSSGTSEMSLTTFGFACTSMLTSQGKLGMPNPQAEAT